MSMITVVWSYLKARPLNTLLNILLLSLGVAIITVLLLVSKQLGQKVSENSRGIDLVVGAKGSPLQLILCNIFHADFPTGNIKLTEAEKIARNRLVRKAIPLALGDSFKGFRIVGTQPQYLELYDASTAQGTLWSKDWQVTVGSNVADKLNLKLGDNFSSTHGLTIEGHGHDEQMFVVVGILRSTNTVVDNLIFSNIESIWRIHGTATEPDSVNALGSTMSKLVPSVSLQDSTREITSLLIQYRSPMGAIQMPRWVNSQSSLQAASPAFETARLFSIIGIGMDVLRTFAYVIVFISALSIFIALYNSLRERKYDLAIMRSMGATRQKLLIGILAEGATLTLLGCIIGVVLAHTLLTVLPGFVHDARKAGLNGFVFYVEEWIILAASLFLGMVCAIIPSIQAYRTDISKVLGGNA